MRCLRGYAVAGAAGLAIALGGCVSLPTRGPVNNTRLVGGAGFAQDVKLVPRPPGPDWSAAQIVTGFLAASASALSGQSMSVAQAYLAPPFKGQWKPDVSSPTVIDSSLTDVYNAIVQEKLNGAPPRVNDGRRQVDVQFMTHHVETLQRLGNIVVSSKKHTYVFSLVGTSDGWRIASVQLAGRSPSFTLLLLTQSDFENNYQPRNLYFVAGDTPGGVLVPIPVFIPQAQAQAEAQALTKKLLSAPNGWFKYATTTAFPPGTRIGGVEVSGIKAVVNLDLPASMRPTKAQLHSMEAQLVWTLTSSPYSGGVAGIGSVQLAVRHGPSVLLLPQNFRSRVPGLSSGQPYFQALGSGGSPVVESAGQTGPVAIVPTPPGLGTGLFTAIALSPGKSVYKTLAACRGRDVYLAPTRWKARVIRGLLPAHCTSLSWDSIGNLWAITENYVYQSKNSNKSSDVYQITTTGQTLKANAVLMGGLKLPAPGRGQLPYRVLSFQVAPDGVRAAMIVQSRAGIELVVAPLSFTVPYVFLEQAGQAVQVVGSDIPHPTALSWQDPDNLLVLGQSPGAQPYLYRVPLNGGPSTPSIVPIPSGVILRWLAVSQQGVAVGSAGRSQGQIWLSQSWRGPWTRSVRGSTPVYSG